MNKEDIFYTWTEEEGKTRAAKWRPAPPGVQIGNANTGGRGTFGCVVEKGGERMILSNAHVLAPAGGDKVGTDIFQPDDKKDDYIAKLYSFIQIVGKPDENTVDCALAEPNNQSDITPGIITSDTYEPYILPQGVMDPYVGQRVRKSGVMSGFTTAIVTSTENTSDIMHGSLETRFKNSFIVKRFGHPGDSGALVLDDQTNKAVGLLMGGNFENTLCCSIRSVLEALDCTLVTGDTGITEMPYQPEGMMQFQSQELINGVMRLAPGWHLGQTIRTPEEGCLSAVSVLGPDCPPMIECGDAGGGGIKLTITEVVNGSPDTIHTLREASILTTTKGWNTFVFEPIPLIDTKVAVVLEGIAPFPKLAYNFGQGYSLMYAGSRYNTYTEGELYFRKYEANGKWLPNEGALAFISWVTPDTKRVAILSEPDAEVCVDGVRVRGG